MDSPTAWFLLFLGVGYSIWQFLRIAVREDLQKKEDSEREWTRLYNEWREAEYRERYINEKRRYYYRTPNAAPWKLPDWEESQNSI